MTGDICNCKKISKPPAMQNLYKEVSSRLLDTSGCSMESNAAKRIKTLSGLITGMISKGSSHLPDIGSGLCKNIDANSKTIAAKRFLANK